MHNSGSNYSPEMCSGHHTWLKCPKVWFYFKVTQMLLSEMHLSLPEVGFKSYTCALTPLFHSWGQADVQRRHSASMARHVIAFFPSLSICFKQYGTKSIVWSLASSTSLCKKNGPSGVYWNISPSIMYIKGFSLPQWKCLFSQSCLSVPELVTCCVSTLSFLSLFSFCWCCIN